MKAKNRLEVREALLLVEMIEELIEQHSRNGLCFREFGALIDALQKTRHDIISHYSSVGFYVPEQNREH